MPERLRRMERHWQIAQRIYANPPDHRNNPCVPAQY